MDSESSIVKQNKPSVTLADFVVNNIYLPEEQLDWIHIKFMPFLDSNGSLKFILKVSNPSFEQLPPVKIVLTLQPLHFSHDKITSSIYEHLIVDTLPEGERTQFEVFKNGYSGLLKIPMCLTIDCFPCFDSNDSDWHSPPLYTTVLTAFDLLLNKKEVAALNIINTKRIRLSSTPISSNLDIAAEHAVKLVLKEMRDISETDILAAIFHYKCSTKDKKPFSGYVLIGNNLVEVKFVVSRVIPRKKEAAFTISIFTNATARNFNAMLYWQLKRKLTVLLEDDAFPVQRTSRPTTVIWKKHPTSEHQNFDFGYEAE